MHWNHAANTRHVRTNAPVDQAASQRDGEHLHDAREHVNGVVELALAHPAVRHVGGYCQGKGVQSTCMSQFKLSCSSIAMQPRREWIPAATWQANNKHHHMQYDSHNTAHLPAAMPMRPNTAVRTVCNLFIKVMATQAEIPNPCPQMFRESGATR